MKTRIRATLAAVLATFTVGGVAQQPTPVQEPVPYVQEPTASVAAGITGERAASAEAVVNALNADPSLKGSKLTVAPHDDGVYITGVTPTVQQKLRISSVASQGAGAGGKVANVVTTEELWIDGNTLAAARGQRLDQPASDALSQDAQVQDGQAQDAQGGQAQGGPLQGAQPQGADIVMPQRGSTPPA